MTHPGGRPRTAIPEKEELIELGKDLVEWSSQGIDGCGELRCRYCEWYTSRGFVRKQWEHMREKPEFQWYYEKAQSNLARRYIDGSINSSIAHRYLRVYDPELKKQEDQDKDDDVKRQKDVAATSTATVELKLDKMTQEIAEARAALAQRRASESLS